MFDGRKQGSQRLKEEKKKPERVERNGVHHLPIWDVGGGLLLRLHSGRVSVSTRVFFFIDQLIAKIPVQGCAGHHSAMPTSNRLVAKNRHHVELSVFSAVNSRLQDRS